MAKKLTMADTAQPEGWGMEEWDPGTGWSGTASPGEVGPTPGSDMAADMYSELAITQDEKMSMDSLAGDLKREGLSETASRLDWASDPVTAKQLYDFLGTIIANPSDREQLSQLEAQFVQERAAQDAQATAMRQELTGVYPQASLPDAEAQQNQVPLPPPEPTEYKL